jgi:hypothetical protein
MLRSALTGETSGRRWTAGDTVTGRTGETRGRPHDGAMCVCNAMILTIFGARDALSRGRRRSGGWDFRPGLLAFARLTAFAPPRRGNTRGGTGRE